MNNKEIQGLNDTLTLIRLLTEYIKEYQKELYNDRPWCSQNRAGLKRMSLEVHKKLLKLY